VGAEPERPAAAQRVLLVDLGPEATWRPRSSTTRNGELLDDALAGDNAGYDRNDDQRLWVPRSGDGQGQDRTLVAMVRIYSQSEDVPKSALIAGKVYFSNAGNKAFVVGSGPVQVRCSPTATNLCIGNDNRVDLATQMPAARRSTTR
jgi:hypothetical protein